MERFSNKVAIVTGASSGFGAQIACDLTKAGLTVVGCAREPDVPDIEALQTKLKSAKGKLYARKCDVTVEADIKALIQWIEKELGPIGILVNNAGVAHKLNILDEDNTDKLKQILDTNVLAVAIFTREVFQSMKRNNVDGHIVCINSVLGHSTPFLAGKLPSLNMYAPSKHAITSLVEILRQELITMETKIKITSISPGIADTNIHNLSGYAESVAGAPKLNPEDISNGILYVLDTPPHVQVYELTIKPLGEQF